MCQIFIVTFFDSWEIQFDQVWSSLIHFGQIWSKKIKNKTDVFILSATFYCNIFRLVKKSNLIKFDPFWTDLIQKNKKQKSYFYPFCKCEKFFGSNLIKHIGLWNQKHILKLRSLQYTAHCASSHSSLIHFGLIWSKKIKNRTAIFIPFKNVTTLYTNIFW